MVETKTIPLKDHVESLRRRGSIAALPDLERYQQLCEKYGFNASIKVLPRWLSCRDCGVVAIEGKKKFCEECNKIRIKDSAKQSQAKRRNKKAEYDFKRYHANRNNPQWVEKNRRARREHRRANKRGVTR